MNVIINPRQFTGSVLIPASKSHTIRQLLIASLADGVSEIIRPLDSLDTRSCLNACRALGAEIEEQGIEGGVKWVVKGQGTRDKGQEIVVSNQIVNQQDMLSDKDPVPISIDVGNSGTTLYLALAIAGLKKIPFQFTGDESIQKRSAALLLEALAGVGVSVQSTSGCVPITVQGPWKGGKITLPCPTSQYLSALLIAAPLAPAGTVTEVEVPLLNEKPYIEMTLSYLKVHGIKCIMYDAEGTIVSSVPNAGRFFITGGQVWTPFSSSVPGDFSSAAFPAAAAAITGGHVTLLGLDIEDTQGDKYFLEMLQEMGCEVEWGQVGDRLVPGTCQACTVSRRKPLKGGIFDLNKTPDLLPAAASIAAFANGDTVFTNIAHARIKETDRIAVMRTELGKLGVKCTEKPDGLIVHGKGGLEKLSSVPILDGHGDHRVVMALAVAALGAPFPVEITDAEAAAVTYPSFIEMLTTK